MTGHKNQHTMLQYRICAIALVFAMGGCIDDPDYREEVDFVTFSEFGRFQERLIGAVFHSGTLAVDSLGGPIAYPMRLGPGRDLMVGIDDDFAPYPRPIGERKVTLHNGYRDNRYWVQFAGGQWTSLNIEVHPSERYRASPTLPRFDPPTEFRWCPDTRPCMDWIVAVNRREVRCWRYSLDGREVPVGTFTCAAYHPRQHWHVRGCDDCAVPAVTDLP
jgi:hypothetical protein